MPTTPQHGLLTSLLDYVVEQSKQIDPRALVLTGASDFRRFPKGFGRDYPAWTLFARSKVTTSGFR